MDHKPDLLTERIRLAEGLTLREANIAAVVRVESWLEASIKAYQTIGVDTPEDLERVRALLAQTITT